MTNYILLIRLSVSWPLLVIYKYVQCVRVSSGNIARSSVKQLFRNWFVTRPRHTQVGTLIVRSVSIFEWLKYQIVSQNANVTSQQHSTTTTKIGGVRKCEISFMYVLYEQIIILRGKIHRKENNYSYSSTTCNTFCWKQIS